jgi:hypothetical protein
VVTRPYINAAAVWNMLPYNLAGMFYTEEGGSRILLNISTYEYMSRILGDVFAMTT